MGQVGAYLPLLLLLVIGYVLIFRPAQRRKRAETNLQSALSPGDEVLLSSGIYATIESIDDTIVRVEISPGVVVRAHRGAVVRMIVDRPAVDEQDEDETAGGDDVDGQAVALEHDVDDLDSSGGSDQNRGVS